MTIMISDWASFSQVIPIARKHRLGLEAQEFTNPEVLEKPDKLITILKEQTSDLPMLSIHGPFAELVPASSDPLVRQVARTRFSQAFAAAQEAGAKHLILHSGFYPKTYSRANWIQNSYNFWTDFLRDKPAINMIHVENVYEDDFSPLQELIDKVNDKMGSRLLSINLDIGHVNANSSHSLEEWIDGLGDRIRYAHLHNNAGSLDDHWGLDRGTIDISKVLDLLLEHAPQATWSVETTLDSIIPSLEWLHGKGYL